MSGEGNNPWPLSRRTTGLSCRKGSMLQFARKQLADYKVPRHIVFLPALPRNATGKILKTELRKTAAASS